MAGFYYFLPGHCKQDLVAADGSVNQDLLAGLGLGESLADVQRSPDHATLTDVVGGPSGTAGVLLYPVPRHGFGSEPINFQPKRQDWIEVEGVWIGWLKSEPPAPHDLERIGELVDGQAMLDQLGQEWLIPIVRAPQVPTGLLPVNYRFDRHGNAIPSVKPQYLDLWQMAGEIWDAYNYRRWQAAVEAGDTPSSQRPEDLPAVDPPGANRDNAWLRKQALRLLGINYRIGWVENNALLEAERPILDTMRVHAICQVAIGWDLVAESIKKKETETAGPSPPGS